MATDEGLDDILAAIGYGLWQLPVLILTILTHLVIPIHVMGSALLSAPVEFKCSSTSSVFLTYTNSSVLSHIAPDHNLTRILNGQNTSVPYYDSKCLDVSAQSLTLQDDIPSGKGSFEVEGHPTELQSCPWVSYDKSVFTSTVISQWDLICEKEMLRPLFQMMYSIGAIFGSIVGGQVSDSFGRKRAIQVASFINLTSVVLLYLMPWYTGALLARVLLGGSCNFLVLPAYSLALEISPPKYRTVVGMLLGTAFSVAIIAMAGLAYIIRSWRLLMLLDAAVPFIFLIPLAFYISESPRWLIQHGRGAEAARIMTNAATVNKVPLSQSLADIIEELREKSNVKPAGGGDPKRPLRYILAWCKSSRQSASVYFGSKALRIIMVVSPILWVLQGCLYLGIILNANNFTSNNPFVYIIISGVMDLVSILLATPLSMRLGRRVMISGCFFTGGILLMADLLVPQTLLWLKFVLVMTALMLVAASFQVNFMYTPELYPTVIRARGFAFSSLAGNIGFLMAPLITDLLSPLAWWSVSVTFGCGGILSSLLVPLLPETLHKPLPETIEDVEKRYENSRIIKKKSQKNIVQLEEANVADKDECEALHPT